MSSRRRSPAQRHRHQFPVGSAVEVRSNDVGFKGAWFEATITKTLASSHIVVYSSLLADDSSQPLEEKVPLSMIRPRPPPADPAAVFGLHQSVEAFHNEGWWKGVVTKLPMIDGRGDLSRLYSVCFPMSREEFQFRAGEIRRRMEWVKGRWIPFEDGDDKVISSQNFIFFS